MFYGLFSALNVCSYCIETLYMTLYIYDLQIKLEDGCYRPIFLRVVPVELTKFYGILPFSRLFFAMCTTIALKLCAWLYIYDLQISWKMVAIDHYLEELCPLNFRCFWILQFWGPFPHNVYMQLLHLNFVHAFISIRFKIKLEDDQINSREIVSWDFNYLNRASVSTCVSSFW
jgi:hypothetical protein